MASIKVDIMNLIAFHLYVPLIEGLVTATCLMLSVCCLSSGFHFWQWPI